MAATKWSCDIAGLMKIDRLTPVARQCLDQAGLGRREQLREHRELIAARRGELERGLQVDPDHVTARGEPQLALAGKQHLPGFMLLSADQGVRAVGAGPAVGATLAPGAGQVVVAAGLAVRGPSARPEVPAAEGRDNDMDASR